MYAITCRHENSNDQQRNAINTQQDERTWDSRLVLKERSMSIAVIITTMDRA